MTVSLPLSMNGPTPATRAAGPPRLDQRIRTAADSFESAFLAEMLKAAGLGRAQTGLGGGIGEEQFASFLVQAQAEQITRAGGLGLSDMVYDSIRERMNE